MGALDIVLSVFLLYGVIRGLMKGLFVEVASLVALIAGVYGAIHFSDFVSGYLKEHIDWDQQYLNIIAFATTFVIIVVVISLAGKALTKLADFAALGFLNKLLGGLFGGLKVGLILSVVLLIFDGMNKSIPFIDQPELEQSVLYKPVKSLAPMIFPILIQSDSEEDAKEEE